MGRVAIAACAAMMAFGWIGTAEAYFIEVDATAPSPEDRYAGASFTFDTTGNLFGNGSYEFQNSFPGDDTQFTLTSSKVKGSAQKSLCGTGCSQTTYNVVFADVTFTDTSFHHDSPVVSGDVNVTVIRIDYSAASDFGVDTRIIVGAGETQSFGDIGFGATFSVTAIPLPPSLSAFGVSLISIGGLGYLRRRTAA